ncbi:MAG: type II toxin-antitoxin system VapB family antitoxin [Chromatiales bacterium]
MRWLERSADFAGICAIHAEVRASNRSAQSFYRSLGYRLVGLWPGYYCGREAAARMSRTLRSMRWSELDLNDAKLTSPLNIDQWSESQRAHATENYALGPTLFLQMLKDTKGLDVSLEQRFAAEKPIQECIAKAQADKPEGDAVAGARRTTYDPTMLRRVYNYLLVYTCGSPMRTNIVIDEKLISDAIKATGARTKREAVELGLKALIQLKKQEVLKGFRGKLKWRDDLDRMRFD